MIAVITLLLALGMTLVITRFATVALTLTGMSRQSAQFQARSALTGCGFTTAEAESVMKHPVRRRVVMTLMLLGNAGIVTVIATLIASISGASGGWLVWTRNIGIMAAGIVFLLFIANSQWIDRQMSPFIEWALKRFGRVQACDYASLFRLANGYSISEMLVETDDWLANRTLIELNLPAEGVMVLGIQRRGGDFVGAPTGKSEIRPGDTLILYGMIERIDELDARKADRDGAAARRAAVLEQQQVVEEQESLDVEDAEREETELELNSVDISGEVEGERVQS